MYSQLIKRLKQGNLIQIAEKIYEVKTKTFYANQYNENLNYVKFILTNKKILVINPKRKAIFLGEIVKDFYQKEYFPDKFEWNGLHFNMFEKDYQIVTKTEFGKPQECEGECIWVDYSCEEDESKCIDMAYIYKEKKRADILAQWINIKDIKIIN